jgi:S-adenosylmethionine hydrolase
VKRTTAAALAGALALCPLIAGGQEVSPPPVNGRVALVTDYSADDFYVGALKGAIVTAWPEAVIDDLTHGVPNFDVAGGSFMLAAAAREWPPGTVFVVVVDPGVGTERRSIALTTDSGHLFVGPDNGVFTHVVREMGLAAVHEITNPQLLRTGALSSTFHGRDIYGPIGAHLASGKPLADIGPALNDVHQIPLIEPQLEGGELRAQVLLADHYGNLITNVPQAMIREMGLEQGERLAVSFGPKNLIVPLVRTYGDVPVGSPLALINSQGLLELAVNQGSLAAEQGVASGAEVRIGRQLFR